MGGRQHKLIAKLVANQIGIDDPTILCLASAYPDQRNDPEFAQVRDPRDYLPIHHDRERSKDVYRWLGEARGYHLRGNNYSRDRVLGIALHYIADAYSPFGGGDDDHNEFERQVGCYAKQTLSSDLDQTYTVEAHSAPAYILNNLHKGPSKRSVERRFVQLWLRHVYSLSLLAAKAVAAPRHDQNSEAQADRAYEDAVAGIEQLAHSRQKEERTLKDIPLLLSWGAVERLARVPFGIIISAAVGLSLFCLYLLVRWATDIDLPSSGRIIWVAMGSALPLLFAVLYWEYGLDWNRALLEFIANWKRHWRAWGISREYAGRRKNVTRDYRRRIREIGSNTSSWYLKPSARL